MGIASKSISAAIAAAGLYAGVSAAMATGLTRAKRIVPEDTPESVGLPFEDVTFEPRGGGPDLSGWLIPSPGKTLAESALASPWIVMVHGFGTNRADPTAGLMGLARDLNSLGYALCMYDARGCGKSDGSTGSVGYYERLDLLGALDMLALRGVAPGRTALLGFSLGAATCLLVGSVPGTCAAVVADSPFADLRLTIRHSAKGVMKPLALFHPGMKYAARTLFGIDLDELSPARALAGSDVPCLVILGENDQYVPPGDATILARALRASPASAQRGDREMWRVSGVGHIQAYREERGAYIEKVASFLANHVNAAARQAE